MTHRRIEGDCLEVMRDLPRGHYDLLLTDPPYAMPAKYYAGVIGKRRWSDTSIMTGWWRVVMERVVPLLKENSSMAVFCNADSMAVFWPLLYEVASHNHLVVWSKGGGGTGYPFMGRHELIAVAVLGKGAQPRPRGGTWDVIECPIVPPNKKVHLAQKPRDLLIALTRQLCPEGGRVLDPFAGSHSTEAACDSLGLECTSIEWGEEFAMPDDQTELFERPAACSRGKDE